MSTIVCYMVLYYMSYSYLASSRGRTRRHQRAAEHAPEREACLHPELLGGPAGLSPSPPRHTSSLPPVSLTPPSLPHSPSSPPLPLISPRLPSSLIPCSCPAPALLLPSLLLPCSFPTRVPSPPLHFLHSSPSPSSPSYYSSSGPVQTSHTSFSTTKR